MSTLGQYYLRMSEKWTPVGVGSETRIRNPKFKPDAFGIWVVESFEPLGGATVRFHNHPEDQPGGRRFVSRQSLIATIDSEVSEFKGGA